MKTLRNIIIFALAIVGCISAIQAQGPLNDNGSNNILLPNWIMSEPIANTLYGHSFSTPSSLYTIDSTTGEATLVGSIGYSNITDVAFRDTVLYGITFTSFVSINPATGVGTFVGPLGFSGMNALAVSASGVFYAASTNGTLINVNEDTGQGIHIGNFGSGLGSSGDMAFDKNGALYAAITRTGYSTDWLAIVNLQSGQATPLWNIGYPGVHGLSYLNDELYGVTSAGLVLHIDVDSGNVTQIGATGIVFGGLTTSPDAIPFLELPYDYTGQEFIDESRDTEMGGKVNSYFDHQYPTYCDPPNVGGCSPTDYRAVNFHGYDGGQSGQNQPPYNVTYNGHDGIDFKLPGSPQVLAAATGEVIEAEYDSCKGNVVSIQHSGGYITRYYHLASFAPGLGVGSVVTRSSIYDPNAFIGIMGNTGSCSAGAHIHFMVENADGIVVDPYGWKPKVDSAWYGMEDPWLVHNANLPQPVDAASHYLWLHPLGSTAVASPNSNTNISSPSGDVDVTFFAGTYPTPIRIEFEDNLNPVLVNGIRVKRSFFVMAYQNDISPIQVLNQAIRVEYVLPQELRASISPNAEFVVWNSTNASWQFLPTNWDPINGIAWTTSSRLGTFALVDMHRIYLPSIHNNAQQVQKEQIAFAGNDDGNREIYVMNIDGTEKVNLTNNSAKDEAPSWSPKGSQIAFHSNRTGYNQIYTMNADGSNQLRVLSSPHIDEWPYWSPTSNRIAFSRVANHNGDGIYRSEVFTVDVDGSKLDRLTYSSGSTGSAGHGCWPSGWTPDGDQILFYCYTGTNRLWIMDANGSSQSLLLDDIHWNAIPSMSPDGQEVVFASYRDGNYEIYKKVISDPLPVRLTNDPNEDWRPVWNSSGTKILFESQRSGHTQVWWMNSDGSNQERITNNTTYAGQATWRP